MKYMDKIGAVAKFFENSAFEWKEMHNGTYQFERKVNDRFKLNLFYNENDNEWGYATFHHKVGILGAAIKFNNVNAANDEGLKYINELMALKEFDY